MSSLKKIVIITGEVSGEIHGAKLISALKNVNPSLEISGIGGDLMSKEGMVILFHIEQMAFLGIGEIIKHLPFIRKVFNKMLKYVQSTNPDAVILIDYPGFNLRFARALKKHGIPVIYYISPQLWAWGKNRVKKIKKYVDKMLVLFPFEVDFYNEYGIEAKYVGHPIVDSYYQAVNPKVTGQDGGKILGLLPGSRKQEIDRLLPNMILTVRQLYAERKIHKAIVARVNNIPLAYYKKYVKQSDPIEIYESSSLAIFYNQLDAALVSSGTATLETAYFQVPMLIVYRVSKLTWFLGKLLVNLKMIGLANIIAGEKVADELLQRKFKPAKAAGILKALLEPEENKKVREKLKIIQQKLGSPGVSDRAANLINDFLESKE